MLHFYPAFPGSVLVGFPFDFKEDGIRIDIFPESYLEPGPFSVVVGQVQIQVPCIKINRIVLECPDLTYLQYPVLILGEQKKFFQLECMK